MGVKTSGSWTGRKNGDSPLCPRVAKGAPWDRVGSPQFFAGSAVLEGVKGKGRKNGDSRLGPRVANGAPRFFAGSDVFEGERATLLKHQAGSPWLLVVKVCVAN